MEKKRIVLVTGGSGGIGRALSAAFLANGDTVVVADINADAAAATAGELGCLNAHLDITDPEQAAGALQRIHDSIGSIDVLVNNAGLLTIHGLLTELSVEDFDRIVSVNVHGTFLMTQLVARQMIADGTRGAIVNLSSIGARQPTKGMGGYEATKAAVDALTRWAAIELAEHGIRVNAVAPGPVLTPMLQMGMPEGSPARAAWESRIPLGTMASVEAVAAVAVFLASDGARHVTGTSVPVDGGQLLT